MRTILPYPLLAAGLALMWLLLAGFTLGQLMLAILVAVAASHALGALGVMSPAIRRWLAIPKLLGVVIFDVAVSNIRVMRLLLFGSRERHSGFVTVPLALRNPSGLAILAIIVTSTPGTAWVDYNSARGELLIHVFDLIDDDDWETVIKTRYERLLMEIFE